MSLICSSFLSYICNSNLELDLFAKQGLFKFLLYNSHHFAFFIGDLTKGSVSPFNDYTLPLSNTADDEIEYKFWKYLRDTVVGKSSRVGLDKEIMAKQLWKLRTKSIVAVYGCNIIWIIILAYFFSVISENTSKLNSFAMISGFLYGISFAIQLIGMTVHRAQDSFERLVRYANKNSIPEWIISKTKNTWRGHKNLNY
ncbi:unnamed protein product [Acanthosepion pharaonis]|uniref:Uncharacterized protein n=1 Tax=Acanthosepion pharaonis TaxID=158019 RepID=A0A812D785_ACAPH|nr:unnamed protein product [Sepia pharaonis]